jgi:hypothetical protein
MTDTLVEELQAALGSRGVLTSPEDRVRFESGWRYGKGVARCIARPASTEEVARVLTVCASHGARVIAQGSNTGLTPKWRAQAGFTYLRFDKTNSLEFLLQADDIAKSIGAEVFLGTQYRPFLTNNVILQFGASALFPDDGFARVYDSNDIVYNVFTTIITTW